MRIIDPITSEVLATLNLGREATQLDADAWAGTRSSTGGSVVLEVSEGVHLVPRQPAAPDPVEALDNSLAGLIPKRQAAINRLKAQVARAMIAHLMQPKPPESNEATLSFEEAEAETMRLGGQFYDSHGPAILAWIDGSGFRVRSQIEADGRPWLEWPHGDGVIRDIFRAVLPAGEVGDRCILTDADALEIASLLEGTMSMAKLESALMLLVSKLQ